MLIQRALSRAIVLWLVVCGSAACNAVLGIERAELGQTSASLECAVPEERPVERCMTTTKCDSCVVTQCGDAKIGNCLMDTDCREGLVRHRVCVRDGCEDETGRCGECLGAVPGAKCFAECGDKCQGSEIVSLCELFCACMDAKCPGSVDDCMKSCSSTPDWVLDCRLTHCERALNAQSVHCMHATDEIHDACPGPDESPPTRIKGCPASRGLIGYGCDIPNDCCSGFCQDGICQ